MLGWFVFKCWLNCWLSFLLGWVLFVLFLLAVWLWLSEARNLSIAFVWCDCFCLCCLICCCFDVTDGRGFSLVEVGRGIDMPVVIRGRGWCCLRIRLGVWIVQAGDWLFKLLWLRGNCWTGVVTSTGTGSGGPFFLL